MAAVTLVWRDGRETTVRADGDRWARRVGVVAGVVGVGLLVVGVG